MSRSKTVSTVFSAKKTSIEKSLRKKKRRIIKKKRYKSRNKQLISHYFNTLIYINSDRFTKNSSLLKIDKFMHLKIIISTRCS